MLKYFKNTFKIFNYVHSNIVIILILNVEVNEYDYCQHKNKLKYSQVKKLYLNGILNNIHKDL